MKITGFQKLDKILEVNEPLQYSWIPSYIKKVKSKNRNKIKVQYQKQHKHLRNTQRYKLNTN